MIYLLFSLVKSTAGRANIQILLVTLAIAGVLIPAADAAQARPTEVNELRESDRRALEELVTSEVQRTVDRQRRAPGPSNDVKAKVRLIPEKSMLVIELGKGYIPTHYGAQFEELQRELQTTALETLQGYIIIREIRFLYDGKSIFDYHPENDAGSSK